MATTPPSPSSPPNDDGRLPWLDAEPVSPRVAVGPAAKPLSPGSGLMWPVALMVAALIAAGAFILGRGSHVASPPPVLPTVLAPARPLKPVPAPTLKSAQTPPALARVASKEAREAAPAAPGRHETPTLHLRPEQVRAVRRIASSTHVRIHRDAVPRVAYSPRVGLPGRVVQLGAYNSVRDAEAAAVKFRYKYRGLLEALPKAVLPFRLKGSRKMFYRVQFVTPSQAYAEVTCQRLRAAKKTCIVVY